MPLDRLFPAQEEKEKIIRVMRKHWFTYVIFLVVTILMLIPFIAAAVFWLINQETLAPVFSNLLAAFGPAYLLTILGLMIYGFVDNYFDICIITDHRIVEITQNGFFKREISEVNLRQIQDVKAEVVGVFPTLLHFGDIHIQTAGETPNFSFFSLPHPYEISKKILDLHEAYVNDKMGEDGKIDDKFDKRPLKSTVQNIPGKEKNQSSGINTVSKPTKEKHEEELDEEGELREGQEVDL